MPKCSHMYSIWDCSNVPICIAYGTILRICGNVPICIHMGIVPYIFICENVPICIHMGIVPYERIWEYSHMYAYGNIFTYS